MKIEEILLEMKDTSELMIDLAYSALLYDNGEIAREVVEMESQIDDWDEQVQQMAVERAIEDRDVVRALVFIRLANSIESVADGALEIADVVLRDIEPHPVVAAAFRESDTTIATVVVPPGSSATGRSLGDLRVASDTGMWVIAIRRKNRWIYGPEKETTLETGDLLVARGPEEGQTELLHLLGESSS